MLIFFFFFLIFKPFLLLFDGNNNTFILTPRMATPSATAGSIFTVCKESALSLLLIGMICELWACEQSNENYKVGGT